MDSACAILNDHCISSRRFFSFVSNDTGKTRKRKTRVNTRPNSPPLNIVPMIDR